MNNTHTHYLTQKQLNSVVKTVFSCIDVAYQVGFFLILNMNKMTDRFGSISRPKKNLTNQ